jgi:hypothetical protein
MERAFTQRNPVWDWAGPVSLCKAPVAGMTGDGMSDLIVFVRDRILIDPQK